MIDKYLAEIAKTGGFWYRLLPYIEFQDPRYGKVSLTKELAQKIEENFKNGIPSYELSLDIDHGKDPTIPAPTERSPRSRPETTDCGSTPNRIKKAWNSSRERSSNT